MPHEVIEQDIDLGQDFGNIVDPNDLLNNETSVVEDDDALPELEIVDDRAPDDRGKKTAKQLNDDEFETDDIPLPGDNKDEREEYVQRAQQRIKETTFRFHAERRAREESERHANAALQLAKSYMQQVQTLQSSYSNNEKFAIDALAETSQKNVKLLTEQLERAHREAVPEDIVKIQGMLYDEQLRLAQLKAYRPAQFTAPDVEQDFARVVPQVPAPQQQAPRIDEATLSWAKRNPWFNADNDMTQYARNIDRELQNRGVNPLTDSKMYFNTIDREMRRRFASYPWLDNTRASTAPPPVVTPGVRPAQRAPKGKVTLTRSQLEVAKHLGISPADYAKEMVKLQKGGNP